MAQQKKKQNDENKNIVLDTVTRTQPCIHKSMNHFVFMLRILLCKSLIRKRKHHFQQRLRFNFQIYFTENIPIHYNTIDCVSWNNGILLYESKNEIPKNKCINDKIYI